MQYCFSQIVNNVCSFLIVAAEKLWLLMGSDFGIAFSGAFAGATAAYLLEKRTRKRQELVQEVRNLNASPPL